MADEEGRFELLIPAEAGHVTIIARAAGHAATRVSFPVQAGEERKGIVLRLASGLEARGRVVDEAGVPIESASVSAQQDHGEQADSALPGVAAARVETDDEGRFVLTGLNESAHTVRVSHPAYATRTATIEVSAGYDNLLTDIVLDEGVRIAGRVIDSAGRAVAGATVAGMEAAGEGNRAEGLSDEEGRFTIGQFSGGSLVALSAVAEGYSPGTSTIVAPQAEAELVIAATGGVRGRVADSDRGGPVPRFSITILAGQGSSSGVAIPGSRSFETEDGLFEWSDVPAGEWTLRAEAPGFQPMKLSAVRVRSGETSAGLVFSLRRGIELNGQVLDAATGVAVADAIVSYDDSGGDAAMGWRRDQGTAQATDADGIFRLDGLPPRQVTLTVNAPTYAVRRMEVHADRESFLTIKLSRGALIAGQVAAATGGSVGGAEVELWSLDTDSGMCVATDALGEFAFPNLSAGRYSLRAEMAANRALPQDVALGAGERKTGVLLVLQSGTTIRGEIRGLLPHEVDGANVLAYLERDLVASGRMVTGNLYTLVGILPGLVQVTVRTSAQRSLSQWIQVSPGASELTLDFEFLTGARLSGTITRSGEPAPGVEVQALPADPRLISSWSRTDGNGSYRIDGLSEGNYTMRVGSVERRIFASGETMLDLDIGGELLSGSTR